MADTKRITIQRKSLGRIAPIGSLYNDIRDTFCGANILKEEPPVSRADISNTELLYEYEDSYEEKFNKLDVEAELKLSILTGLLDLEGSGKYLSDAKESFRSVKGTLICKMTSVEENLNIYREDVQTCISTDGFSNPDATHVVIGIKWGAVMMASFEHKNTKEENKSQVKKELKSYFENISRKGYVDVEEGSKNMSGFAIKLFGDVIPHDKEFPRSFNEASKIMAELPLYVKQYNDGKGIPIEYTLYPLSELAKLLNVKSEIMEFSEEIIPKVIQIYDSLSESKQRLNDLYNDAHSISGFIPDEIFNEISNYVQQAKIEEERFSRELSESLVNSRSSIRQRRTNELEHQIKIFQNGILSKDSIVAFINQHRSVSIKANLILTLKAKNVEYLDKYSNIEHVLHKHTNCHVYIFIDSDEFIIKGNSSPEYNMFQDLYNSDDGSSKFFIADPKICAGISSLGFPVIHHYINGRLESNDYYNDNKMFFMSNLVKFNPAPCIQPEHNLSKKTRLVVPCPNTNCPSTTISDWKCFNCKQDIEYGYNQHFYCGCGESKITNCKFRCNSPYHSEGYTPFELNRLNSLLPSTPPEEINILLLGETGVGKSTFINAFANYLKFNTLNEAKSGNMEVLVPSKFTITDENYEMQTIKIGNNDSSEQFENVGMSSTQECKSYVFSAGENRVVRLIDTPGIGDTRGLDQDKKNFENILKFLSYHQHLNGICILLKPNNSRLTVIFKYCIQELLSHLHKNAKDNIVFCFTNARGTFYRPGDALPALKKQLEELKKRSNVEIKINYNTIYCFDNESFRFLAAIKEKVSFTPADEQSFAESWKKSVDESLRLIQYLITCSPHKIMDTLSLNNVRNIVIILSKPLAEIGQLIQTNIKLIKQKQNEVENSYQTIEELKNRMYIPQIDFEPKALGYHRTVCTSAGCVTTSKIEQTNVCKVNYITHCHPRCYCLKNITHDTINESGLRHCAAMKSDGNCVICGCCWDKHMHMYFENEIITKCIVDQNVKMQISKKKSDQETKKAIMKEFQIRVDQLQEEQKQINKISLKFAQFLRQNAIAAFNDAYADYFDHFINEEKIKKNADPINYDEAILKGLETTKRSYLKQIDIIKRAIANNDPSMPPISPKDIADLEQELYNLPINGQTLRKIKDEANRSQTKTFKYKENIVSNLASSSQCLIS